MSPTINDDAWIKVPAFGVIGYVVLLVAVLPTADDRTSTAGWLLLPTIIAIGAITVAATSSRRRWGSKVYAFAAPVTVLVLSLGVALVVQGSPGSEATEPTAAPRTVDEVTGDSGDTAALAAADTDSSSEPLVAPGSGEGFTRVESATDQVADANLGQWTADLYGIDDVVVGSYQADDDPGVTFRYVGVNGAIQAASPEAAGRASLVSAAGTSIVAFEPEADGWLGCNSASAQGTERVSCSWVGEERAVFLRWAGPISMAEAAAVTRAFRDHASVA